MVAKFTAAARLPKVQGQDAPPLWVTVEVWGQQAAWVCDNLRKGEMVFVTGEVRVDTYSDRTTGEVKQALCLKNAKVEKLYPPRDQAAAAAAGAPAQAAAPAATYPAAAPAAAPAPAYQQQPMAARPVHQAAAPAPAQPAAGGYDPFSSEPPY